MTLKYLCPQHRETILSSPMQAKHYWQLWLNQGTNRMDQRDWQQATAYLGSCFEVAEWLLQEPETDSKGGLPHLDRYMVSGHYLAECYDRADQHEQALHYLLTVHDTLVKYVRQKQSQYWLLRTHLDISLTMICRYRQHHGAFKGFYDCCRETQLYLRLCTH